MTKNAIKVNGSPEIVDDIVKKYAEKRANHLFKYLPRHAKKTATAEVKLDQVNHEHGNKYEAEIILNLPNKKITAKDSTGNIMAAIDIVEAKIMAQLRAYKGSVQPFLGKHKLISRLKHSPEKQL
jgi:putative sigma-54 modulation protein